MTSATGVRSVFASALSHMGPRSDSASGEHATVELVSTVQRREPRYLPNSRRSESESDSTSCTFIRHKGATIQKPSLLSAFSQENMIQLKSVASGHALRIIKTPQGGFLDARGGIGLDYTDSNWRVHVRSRSACIVSIHHDSLYIGIEHGFPALKKFAPGAKPGQESQFFVREAEDGHILLEPLSFPGCSIGVSPNGRFPNIFQAKPDTGSFFEVYLVYQGYDADGFDPQLSPEVNSSLPYVPTGPLQVPPLMSPTGSGAPPPGAPTMYKIDASPTSPDALQATRKNLERLYSHSPPPGAPGGRKQKPMSPLMSPVVTYNPDSFALKQPPAPVQPSYPAKQAPRMNIQLRQDSDERDKSPEMGVSDF